MLNYILYFFPLADSFFVADMHLFEHCLSRKIQMLLDGKEDYAGVIFHAETFLDGCSIELYSADKAILEQVSIDIEKFNFTEKDSFLIEEERDLISVEILELDLTEEEQTLYEIFKTIDSIDILELYSDNFSISSTEIGKLNDLLSNFNKVTFDGETLRKKKSPRKSFIRKNKTEIVNEKIIGYGLHSVYTLNELTNLLFFSYLFGRSQHAVIDKEYLKEFDLYLGYMMSLSYRNYFLVLLYMDTNDLLLGKYEKEKTIHSSNEEVYLSKRFVASFQTFIFYEDPMFLQLAKYYMKTDMQEESLSIENFKEAVGNIDRDFLQQRLKEGFPC